MELAKHTKKLDSMHLYQKGYHSGVYRTLCGKPMLGNNYAEDFPERKMCPECREKALEDIDVKTMMKKEYCTISTETELENGLLLRGE